MPIAIVAALVGLAIGLASGGSLRSLAETQFRWAWLLFAGLALQIYFGSNWPGSDVAGENGRFWILIGSNVLVVVFLIANIRLPGIWLAGLGLFLNLIVISSNGAMPVSADAVASFGGTAPAETGGFKHELMRDSTTFRVLGDVIPIEPLDLVISLGDVFLACGILYLVFARTRSSRGRHAKKGAETKS